MKIRPLHDRLLVERLEEKEGKKGGIIIPNTTKEKPQEAKVIAVGNGKVTDEGKKIPLDVKAGDKILFGKYSGSEVKINDKEYLIMREDDVLAILEYGRRTATHAKAAQVRRGRPGGAAQGRQHHGGGREGDAGPEGPQRRHRQEVRQPDDH